MNSQSIRVGDKVRFKIGPTSVIGQVLEDYGPIGLNARHLYRVRYELGRDNWYITELPAVKMEVIEEESA